MRKRSTYLNREQKESITNEIQKKNTKEYYF